MRTYGVLIVILALGMILSTTVPLGCRGAQPEGPRINVGTETVVRTKRKFVQSLIEKNRLAQLRGVELLPGEADWDGLSVQVFPWGIMVSWGREDPQLAVYGMKYGPGSPLVFTALAQYVCAPMFHCVGDVTGDGVDDLVTAESFSSNEAGFFVYPGGKNAPPARFLGSTSPGYDRHALVDFNHDGVFEVVTTQNQPLILDHRLGVPAQSGERYLTVWSLKFGIPRLLLALLDRTPYEIDTRRCTLRIAKHAPPLEAMFVGGPNPRPDWLEFSWNPQGQRFNIPSLQDSDVVVIVNEPMLR